uniref:C2H2-type domain-containing protein n=1 Tax=Cacopsylla melanoneura TaxID=428564 RepID=A0A8D8QP10_9HEMI
MKQPLKKWRRKDKNAMKKKTDGTGSVLCVTSQEKAGRADNTSTSHITQSHRDQVPPKNNSMICEHCGHQSKSKSGLTSHLRHRHPDNQVNTLRPVRVISGNPDQQSSISTQQQNLRGCSVSRSGSRTDNIESMKVH